MIRLSYADEAKAFNHWVGPCMANSQFNPEKLQVVYRLDSGSELPEAEFPHLAGYGGARPVRIGNQTYRQLQLDIYGELMNAIYLANKYGDAIPNQGCSMR
ncbi:MAG: glycoside hydrolase family 15 protein [Sodalis sp. (in: enterobacteria)]|uniref:glycoside hydrolase family 15 protein n=1 Tax=Sodalis sp. (in: enterobacteria) TaxID=1898979 RepID=UPI003F2DCC77